ncbi:MAG: serine/threonine protein kinase [Phycisphaerales bacterium]|nr:serine/threonine protein kinase [Phycisphaerales bacterium]
MTSPRLPSDRDDDLIRAAQAQIESARDARAAGNRFSAGSDSTLDAGHPARRLGKLQSDSLQGYELLQERHRGGQGVVYEATQRATKRRVAIKVLYDGPQTSGSDRRRFQREVEILSQLRHPNVVTVYDSGESSGRFFYVMDLVQGEPVDRWAEKLRARLGVEASGSTPRDFVRDVVRLFIRICDAVNAAHLRGVIHRDLKPGNILVDGAGEPRVLDFGLAKFTQDVPDDSSLVDAMTQPGQFVGSLPWSSPEQAQGAIAAVDIRTDVYALGVLLFHTLTGRFPYRVNGRAGDIVSEICNSVPRPLNEAFTDTGRIASDSRRTRRGGQRRFDDDLETIVQRCLAKERERRYQSAGDLGRDLQHYLAGEAIEARRDSVGYVFSKQLRRYRLQLAVATGFMLVLATGLATSIAAWRTASEQRDLARNAETKARAASENAAAERDRAQQSEKTAARQQREAESVAELLKSLLMAASPLESKRPDMTVREMLDRFDERLGNTLEGQPAAEAKLREIIGQAYNSLGIFDQAAWHLRRAIELRRDGQGENSLGFGLSLIALAHLEKETANYVDARGLFERGLAILLNNFPESDDRVIQAKCGLATVLRIQGHYEQARELLTQCIELARGLGEVYRWQLGSAIHELASVTENIDGPKASEPLLRESLEIYQQVLGDDHPETALVRVDLADSLRQMGQFDEALRLIAEARRVFGVSYGDQPHPRLGYVLTVESLVFRERRDYEASERAGREALALRRQLYSSPHRDTVSSLNNLATLLTDMRRYDESAALLHEAIDMATAMQPYQDPKIGTMYNNLGRALFFKGDHAEALEALRDALELDEQRLGPNTEAVIEDLKGISFTLDAQGKFPEAIATWRDMIERRIAGGNAPADKLIENRQRLAELLSKHARALLDGGQPEAAEPVAREALETRRATYPSDAWRIFSSQSTHGEALLDLQRAGEAEPHLLEAMRGLQAAKDAPPQRIRDTALLLVKLYEQRGDSSAAEKWRTTLESAAPADK